MRKPSFFTRLFFRHRRPIVCRLRLEVLERREVPAGLVSDLANVEGNLAAFYRLSQPDLAGNVVGSAEHLRGLFLQDAGGRPVVQIWTREHTDAALASLETLGVHATLVNTEYHLIEASIDLALLSEVAGLPDVLAVTPAYRPIPRAGSVQTQGDGVVHADLVRAAGFDGASVKVGVISDSTLDISVSRLTGDLPTIVDRYLEIFGTDEGRAMLEIIHDVAPGAALASYSGIFSAASFAQGIRTLAAAGCNVIVDALGYLDQPFFQDGIIAQAVNEVTAAGVVYISAAGNDADLSYESAFVDADPGTSADFHDVDPSAGVDTRQRIAVPRGLTNALVLQWDDPFYTTSGVSHNFDVKVYNDSNAVVASGTTNNLSTQQPFEVVTWSTTGTGSANFHVEIERKAGTGPSLLKYLLLAGKGATVAEFATNSGTIYGQTAAAGAIAVGAVPYYAPTVIEPTSSRGDATIYFAPDGTRLSTPEVRYKPDLVAPDKVNTTFFGTDIPEDADALPNFAGTSAAAPHVAGVAALLLQANPHLTREELIDVLTSTAFDLGDPGRDSVYGYGLVDAEAARVAAQAVADVTPPTAQLVSPITVHGWHATRLTVHFSEPLNPATATNAANYSLVCAGPDAAFGTGDDFNFALNPAYDANARTVALTFVEPFAALPAGPYRLTIDGTNGLKDPAGNNLNAGADQVFSLTVAAKSSLVSVATEPVLPEPFSNLGDPQLDLRPDGTTVMVYANNANFPIGSATFWPQVMIGQYDSGAVSGPYRAAPTNMAISNGVNDVDVAVNATGGVYIYSQGGGMPKLAYQLLNADGRPVGLRYEVGTVLSRPSRVDINTAGVFAMAYGTFGQLFAANGPSQGAAFTIDQQGVPIVGSTVAIDGSGGTVFTWEAVFSNGNADAIFARRFNASRAPLGDEFRVNTTTTGTMRAPEIAMAADGSFVIVWNATQGPGGTGGVLFQRYSAAGGLLGSETRVSSQGFNGSAANSPQAQVAMTPDGRFVVVWRQDDGDGKGIFAQQFAANGIPVGSQMWVSQGVAGNQFAPRVGMADNGDLVVRWRNPNATDNAVWISAFAANGAPSLTAVGTLAGGTEDTPYTITYASLAAAANEADPDGNSLIFRVESVTSGTLTKDGAAVTPGVTLVSAGESLAWTPPADTNGTVNAFTVRAWDGALASATPVQVKVALAEVNDAPSFTKGSNESILEDAGPRSVSNWATNISPGPADESGQAVNFQISTDNDGLFAALPTIDASGNLAYEFAGDANGTVIVTVNAKDNGGIANSGDDTSDPQTFTINVTPVNDVPSFVKGSDRTVNEDSGTTTVSNWATSLSAGPSDESSLTLSFLVSTDNDALFSELPSIDPSGGLTFAPALNANGSATVTVQIQDSGSGTDTSSPQSFTITFDSVNDAPAFAKGNDDSVAEDFGTRSIPGWATNLSNGPVDESGQALTFLASTNNDALFAILPFVDSFGSLFYTPAANANGSATITVLLKDDGGTDEGGVDTSTAHTFAITVSPVNDAPVAQLDGVTAMVGRTLKIKVLTNDFDVEGDPIQVKDFTQPAYGSLRREGNTLVYNTSLKAVGTDAFTYSVKDSHGASSVGMVAITVLDAIAPKVESVRLYYGANQYVNAGALNRAILPWEKLYKVAVVFNETVIADPSALMLTSGLAAIPTTFAYDAAKRTATWTLVAPIESARFTIRLNRAEVEDSSGNLLSTSWSRAFGLLAGDFDGNGIVNKTDLKAIKKRFTKPKVALARLADVDGNGVVNQADLDRATANLGQRLK